jgi:hypothetical protein
MGRAPCVVYQAIRASWAPDGKRWPVVEQLLVVRERSVGSSATSRAIDNVCFTSDEAIDAGSIGDGGNESDEAERCEELHVGRMAWNCVPGATE